MKYIDADLFRKEIERRMDKHWDLLPNADSPEDDWTHNELCELGAFKELEHLEQFLDSLQQPEDVVTTANALLEALSKTPYDNKPITADCLLQVRKKLKEYYPKLSLLCTPATLEKDYKEMTKYLRFGDIPENGKSKIWRGEECVGEEEGVSVYEIKFDKDKHISICLPFPLHRDTLDTLTALTKYDNRPCYIVTGEYIGKGTDGEPLISNIQIEEEFPKIISDEKMKQMGEEISKVAVDTINKMFSEILEGEQKPILEVFGFKVGDAVRLKDGDGRKHIIKSFKEVEGVHGPNFYQVEFEDNSARDGIYPGKEYPNGYFTQMEKLEEEPLKISDLTWEDINTLEKLINNVNYEFRNGIGEESFGKEVLERFREIKGIDVDGVEKEPVDFDEIAEKWVTETASGTADEMEFLIDIFKKGLEMGYNLGKRSSK